MNCPKCDTKRAPTVVTQPADKRDDGRVCRRRECKKCGHVFMSLELLLTDVRSMEQQALNSASSGSVVTPLPTQATQPLVDIENELEGLLAPSLNAIKDALKADSADRTKVDLARWLVADRREYRKALAEAANTTGTEHADPAVQQLANILALVPDPVEDAG